MPKFIIRLITAFIPSKKLRQAFRARFELMKIDKGNTIDIKSKKVQLKSFIVRGKNNVVIIEESARCLTLDLKIIGNNNVVKIGKTVWGILHLEIHCPMYEDGTTNNCNVSIGNNTHVGCPTTMIFAEDKTNITIGDDCMISSGILFHNTDMHSVVDKNTHKLLNRAHDITIGNRVWIAQKATFLKNTKIASNSIVGIGSLVTKKFDKENVIIAGTPAKIVKENIDWNWECPDKYELLNQDEQI